MSKPSFFPLQDSEAVQTVPLAYHEICMERNRRIVRCIVLGFVATIAILMAGFVYLWLQYDYVSSTEQSGIYNVADSTGNIISSDIQPEDISKILSVVKYDNGTDKKNDGENP
jgi:hypothetical protein